MLSEFGYCEGAPLAFASPQKARIVKRNDTDLLKKQLLCSRSVDAEPSCICVSVPLKTNKFSVKKERMGVKKLFGSE